MTDLTARVAELIRRGYTGWTGYRRPVDAYVLWTTAHVARESRDASAGLWLSRDDELIHIPMGSADAELVLAEARVRA